MKTLQKIFAEIIFLKYFSCVTKTLQKIFAEMISSPKAPGHSKQTEKPKLDSNAKTFVQGMSGAFHSKGKIEIKSKCKKS